MEESSWIYNQLTTGSVPLLKQISGGKDLSINKDDITKFLELHHVQKLDVSNFLIILWVNIFF